MLKKRPYWFYLSMVFLLPIVLYILAALSLSIWTVNHENKPPDEGVEILLWNNGWHTNIILPSQTAEFDWTQPIPLTDFANLSTPPDYIAFGWGDKDFYINTPSADDIQLAPAFKAVFASKSSILHVLYFDLPIIPSDISRVYLSTAQYQQLVDFIQDSFLLDKTGHKQKLTGVTYASNDAFYLAKGQYSPIQTCNEWVGQALRTAGVRIGVWTPFASTLLWYL